MEYAPLEIKYFAILSLDNEITEQGMSSDVDVVDTAHTVFWFAFQFLVHTIKL
jgi:hypothetical protein